ncbi:MAG: hypothetical protein KIT75_03295 [Planctomycetota bacterium]|nr:hypothetical protein [Planctomycetota bacterium]MCW8134679.1 hypothetical protein [Planctomycetota bacterium]
MTNPLRKLQRKAMRAAGVTPPPAPAAAPAAAPVQPEAALIAPGREVLTDHEARVMLSLAGRVLSSLINTVGKAIEKTHEQERIEQLAVIDAQEEVPASLGRPSRMRRLQNNIASLYRLAQRLTTQLYRVLMATNPSLRRLQKSAA